LTCPGLPVPGQPHPARWADAERVCRAPEREPARRTARRVRLPDARRGAAADPHLAARLQPPPPPQSPGLPHSRGSPPTCRPLITRGPN